MQQQEDLFIGEGARQGRSRRFAEITSFALAGLALGAAFAFTGHYLGKHANARAVDDGHWLTLAVPAPVPLMQKAETDLELDARIVLEREVAALPPDDAAEEARAFRVVRSGKSDMLRDPLITSAALSAGRSAVSAAGKEDPLRDPLGLADAAVRKLLLAATPPVEKIERSWRLSREARRRILAARKHRLREQICLAKAIYFEARSESLRGQMAVAQVVLNRVKDPRFPNTICGVVYQGAERRNACQFSFACDGKSDMPTHRRAWAQARRLAARAMKGQIRLRELEGVAFYHADYVRPRWAGFKRKVTRIGRHIFYRDG
jgi:spore germination cell wall hydrolase CwlJ-like protein